MRRMICVATLACASTLSACATPTYPGSALLIDPATRESQSLAFEVKGAYDGVGLARLYLPSGELLEGAIARTGVVGAPAGGAFTDPVDPGGILVLPDGAAATNARARLVSAQGRTAECAITLNDVQKGADAGGQGRCRLSSGEEAAFQF